MNLSELKKFTAFFKTLGVAGIPGLIYPEEDSRVRLHSFIVPGAPAIVALLRGIVFIWNHMCRLSQGQSHSLVIC